MNITAWNVDLGVWDIAGMASHVITQVENVTMDVEMDGKEYTVIKAWTLFYMFIFFKVFISNGE